MKKTIEKLMGAFRILLLGFFTTLLVFVVNFALDMAGVVDLEKAIHNMKFEARTQITEFQNEVNEKREANEKKKELKKEYKEKLKELKDEYNM